MQVLDFITLLIIMAAFFTLINVKYLKLPSTIGLMILALGLSVFIVFGEFVFSLLRELTTDLMTKYKFSDVLFRVMLSFLLFAGALEMDLKKLGEEKWPILILATVGVLISTFIVGTAVYYVLALPFINIPIDYIHCLLFGALISPTDPIAVLAMVKKTPVSKNLESQIAGESLFNDGIGVVVFLSILAIAENGAENFQPVDVVKLFGIEVLGGLALGALFGFVGLYLLKIIDNAHTEIEVLVTLSMVLGGASVADFLHVSSPLAMVVMGLWVGREGREGEDAAGEYVYKFWHLMDEAMNAILFILIGLQIIRIAEELQNNIVFLAAIPLAIIIVLLSRFVGVGAPIVVMRTMRKFPRFTVRILTWSGLRGGISVALALSLYEETHSGFILPLNDVNLITAMTYGVVLFSIVVQGLTMKKFFDMYARANANNPDVEQVPIEGAPAQDTSEGEQQPAV